MLLRRVDETGCAVLFRKAFLVSPNARRRKGVLHEMLLLVKETVYFVRS